MITNLLKKVLVYSTIGTVIGFSTILGAANSAAALIVESESTNNKGVIQDISHIVFYMKDSFRVVSLYDVQVLSICIF